MLFNSYAFLLIFLPLTVFGFCMLSGRNNKATILFFVAASFFFYGWNNYWQHITLLVFSICANFLLARKIACAIDPITRRIYLAISVSFNLVLLAYFKYANFFLTQLGFNSHYLGVLLPIGISFYTFTQIAYLVDVYKGHSPEHSAGYYALFVSWFPHLIAGPIIHHKEMMPQFRSVFQSRPQLTFLIGGLSILAIGLAKKVLLADTFAIYADPIFNNSISVHLTFAEAWVGALAYTFQIYFDFSGYTDMAIGISYMFGVRLPVNFNSPYKADSIIDFWRRWHMTLSRFLRDYVYIPLGGNRKGATRRHLNLLLTMALGGLWHGAEWTFVVWGILHGTFLIVNHAWHRLGIILPRSICVLCTFFTIVITWVFFRAPDFTHAWAVLKPMLFGSGLSLPRTWAQFGAVFPSTMLHFDGPFHNGLFDVFSGIQIVLVGFAIVWFCPNTQAIFRNLDPTLPDERVRDPEGLIPLVWRPTVAFGCIVGVIFAASFACLGGPSPFLYFRF